MLQSPPPPKQLAKFPPSKTVRYCPAAIPPVLLVASVFGETEDAAKHFSSWPSRAETRPKVGGIPGWPVAHWGGWPWILWEKIRMKHLSFNKEGQKMTVHYDVFFVLLPGFFFSEQFHCSSIAWVSNPIGSLDMGVYIPCQLVRDMNSSSEGSLSRYILTFWIFTCFFSLNSAMFCIVLPLFGSNKILGPNWI